MAPRQVIVIGASAGGLQVVAQVLGDLPAELPVAVFIVIHTGAEAPGVLARILGRAGPLAAEYGADGEPIVAGRVYIARPSHHLLIEGERVRVTQGPRENGFRPAIDPLFRTAAAAYGRQVIGVVLSGGLDDGTAGLARIKQRGGIAIVQDPDEAMSPGMPASAIQHVDVDYVLRTAEIGSKLVALAGLREQKTMASQRDDKPDRAEVGTNRLDSNDRVRGVPSPYTCPECGGTLWESQENGLPRFTCHVGHAYSIEALAEGQSEALEHALWTALRALEEGAALRRSMAEKARRRGSGANLSGWMDEQAVEWENRAATIRRALVTDSETGDTGSAAAVENRARRAGEK